MNSNPNTVVLYAFKATWQLLSVLFLLFPPAVTEAAVVPLLVTQQMFPPGKHSRNLFIFACFLSSFPLQTDGNLRRVGLVPQITSQGRKRAVWPERGFHSVGGNRRQTRTNGGFHSRISHLVVSDCDETASRVHVSHYDGRAGPQTPSLMYVCLQLPPLWRPNRGHTCRGRLCSVSPNTSHSRVR